ncbi:PilZ domain-containing protein [Thermodesulfobacteriota bacterium]
MNNNTMKAERRSEQRYKLLDHAEVVVSPNTTYMSYQIMNISKSGLAFCLLGEKIKPEHISGLTLFYNQSLYIDSVPVSVVSENQIDNRFLSLRRYGVRFGPLTATQERKLEHFIRDFSQGPAMAEFSSTRQSS